MFDFAKHAAITEEVELDSCMQLKIAYEIKIIKCKQKCRFIIIFFIMKILYDLQEYKNTAYVFWCK